METDRLDNMVEIAGLVRSGHARSRADIAKLLSMRSTTVSELVGELVAHSLLVESHVKTAGRGRPVRILTFNRHCLGAILISVQDKSLLGQVVDLEFEVLAEAEVVPPRDADNNAMTTALQKLAERLEKMAPAGVEIACIAASLPGLLDVPRGLWCVSSRWPQMQDLNVLNALAGFARPVTLVRNLDAELDGFRLSEPTLSPENILLLHWGYGIGASYFSGQEVINRQLGRFCEIGHWSLGNQRNIPCTCGNHDCLETVAALWSIGADLREAFQDLPRDEKGLAQNLRHVDILESPVMQEALKQVLRITTNLCRLLFPDRIVLTGPFVQHPEIFRRFVETIAEAPLLTSTDKIRVVVNEFGRRFEIMGALHTPLDLAQRNHLSRSGKAKASQQDNKEKAWQT